MIYQYVAPGVEVREFVRDYLIAHFVFNKEQPIPFKRFSPRPEQALTFLTKGYLNIVNLKTGQTHKSPSVSICGQQTSRYNYYLPAEYLMLRINFHPGALYRLFRVPVSEFTNSWFDAELVASSEIKKVNERLVNCLKYGDMIDVAESYLKTKIKNLKDHPHPIDNVASEILEDPSRFSMAWLASQACLSYRQFDRKFIERNGISPKLFNRIIRFFKAYKYKESHKGQTWIDIALQFGYTDYQHMSKDFQEFTHGSPNQWIEEYNQSPERILHLE
jgi:AraC-like DNA-binding protein